MKESLKNLMNFNAVQKMQQANRKTAKLDKNDTDVTQETVRLS